jgi:hypothetical protein
VIVAGIVTTATTGTRIVIATTAATIRVIIAVRISNGAVGIMSGRAATASSSQRVGWLFTIDRLQPERYLPDELPPDQRQLPNLT